MSENRLLLRLRKRRVPILWGVTLLLQRYLVRGLSLGAVKG